MSWRHTDDLTLFTDERSYTSDFFGHELIHRPMLPSLAYVYGKVLEQRSALRSVGDLLLYFSRSVFPLSGEAREHRDNVSVLPICLNKEIVGLRSLTGWNWIP